MSYAFWEALHDSSHGINLPPSTIAAEFQPNPSCRPLNERKQDLERQAVGEAWGGGGCGLHSLVPDKRAQFLSPEWLMYQINLLEIFFLPRAN